MGIMLRGEKMSNEVFISYSTEDADFANSSCEILEKNGVRCWIAPRNITPGLEWMAAIIEGIDECKVMVLIFSSHANRSAYVRREVENAISKGLTILPFRIEKVDPIGALLLALSGTQRLDGFHPPITTRLNELVETVLKLLGKECESVTNVASPPLVKSQSTRSCYLLIVILLVAVAMPLSVVWFSMNREDWNPSKIQTPVDQIPVKPKVPITTIPLHVHKSTITIGSRVILCVDQAPGYFNKSQLQFETISRGMKGKVEEFFPDGNLYLVLRDMPNGDEDDQDGLWISCDHLQLEENSR